MLSGLESLRKGLIMYHELGLTTKEIYADLKAAGWDKSLTTLKRHQTELRKEGLIAASSMARQQIAPKSERKPVENSTPIFTPPINDIRREPQPQLVTATVVEDDEFRVSRCDSDEAERDYDECLRHIDAIVQLTKKYFHSGWDNGKWYELAGECRTIEACCTNHCGSNYGAGSQRRGAELWS